MVFSPHIPSISFFPCFQKVTVIFIFWEHRSYQKGISSDLSVRSRRHQLPYTCLLAVDDLAVFPLRPGPPSGCSSHASRLLKSSAPAVASFPASSYHFFLFCRLFNTVIPLISSLLSSFIYLYTSFCWWHSCQCFNEKILYGIGTLYVYVYIILSIYLCVCVHACVCMCVCSLIICINFGGAYISFPVLGCPTPCIIFHMCLLQMA